MREVVHRGVYTFSIDINIDLKAQKFGYLYRIYHKTAKVINMVSSDLEKGDADCLVSVYSLRFP